MVAALTGVFSCRQIAGIQDNPAMDIAPTSTACGLPWGTSTCASCVNTWCCPASTACAQDPACSPSFQCLGACKLGDWPCRTQCQIDHPASGAGELPSLVTCNATHCANECGLTCGALPLAASADAAVACQGCFEMDTNRCASALACTSSADCVGWLQCQAPGTTPDVRRVCDDRFGLADAGVPGTASPVAVLPPEIAAPLQTLTGGGPCKGPCAIGGEWTCVDRTVWPSPTLGGITLETQVVDSMGQKPVSGVEVSICRFGDPNCLSPLNSAHVYSDANGLVTVRIPPGSTADQAVDADSYAQLTSPTTFPALYFFGYPVSEPRAPIGEPYAFVILTSNPQPGWDPSLGLLNALAIDCAGGAGYGVQFAIDLPDASGVIPYYFDDNNKVDTTLKATTPGGAPYGGGFVNVPPGTVTITATPIALGKPSSHAQVLIRAGTLTQVFLFPGMHAPQ